MYSRLNMLTHFEIETPTGLGAKFKRNLYKNPETVSTAFELDALPLSPEEIGKRLGAAHNLLNKNHANSASTTIYDGKSNLITATYSNICLFIATYDAYGYPQKVQRINPMPKVSKTTIFHVNPLGPVFNALKVKRISKIQIIYCEGYVNQEDGLLTALQLNNPLGILSEHDLAKKLAKELMQDLIVSNDRRDGREKNISFLIQTITSKTNPFLLGLYTSHTNIASKKISEFLRDQFTMQFAFTPIEDTEVVYAHQDRFTHINCIKIIQNLIFSFDYYKTQGGDGVVSEHLDSLLKKLEEGESHYPLRLRELFMNLTQNSYEEHHSFIDYLKANSDQASQNLLYDIQLNYKNACYSGFMSNPPLKNFTLTTALMSPLLFFSQDNGGVSPKTACACEPACGFLG